MTKDGWVPKMVDPRIELLEETDLRFWEGHLTIANAIMLSGARRRSGGERQGPRRRIVVGEV
jgi:hypothetical protein